LTFSTPDAVSSDWLDAPTRRVGAIAADFFGHGPFAVWRSARLVEDGFVDVAAPNMQVAAAASQGVRALTAPVSVGKVDGYDVLQIGRYPALNVLLQSLPRHTDTNQVNADKNALPLGTLMCGVTFGDPQTAIKQGRYRLNHVVSADRNNQSITLSHPLNAGEHMFWAIRDKLASERAMHATLTNLEQEIGRQPDFAMLFPCLSRGSSFYGGRDRDIEIIQQRYPGLPLIGFYGNGQIAPLGLGAHLYQFSAAVALFSEHGAAQRA
jgi:small ligand-binding sensory domain FIST